MINTILGIKLGMSTRFDQHGHRMPVTVIEADPNVVLLKTTGKLQLGFGQKKKVKKTDNAFVSVFGFAPRTIKEVKLDAQEALKTGDKITVAIFAPQDQVKITGTTRGKGFAGGVKRWGFAGGPKTHGQSDRHRAPGSIGQTTTPGRVYKGKRMAGHMGVDKLTVGGLEVLEVDIANNLLIVKGAIPGPRNGQVLIQKTGRVKHATIDKLPTDTASVSTTGEVASV